MKKFMAIYTGSAAAFERAQWHQMDPEKRKALQERGMKAWGEWMVAHRGQIVDTGGPLGKTKCVSPTGVADIRNSMSAYVIVQAESHEAAARMFEGHPHFSIFPGDAVEIMECLPIPGQG